MTMTTAALQLTCLKCTREAGFEAIDYPTVRALAVKAGWELRDISMREMLATCPRCLGPQLFTCPCGHKRHLKPGDVTRYCPACKTVAA